MEDFKGLSKRIQKKMQGVWKALEKWERYWAYLRSSSRVGGEILCQNGQGTQFG